MSQKHPTSSSFQSNWNEERKHGLTGYLFRKTFFFIMAVFIGLAAMYMAKNPTDSSSLPYLIAIGLFSAIVKIVPQTMEWFRSERRYLANKDKDGDN